MLGRVFQFPRTRWFSEGNRAMPEICSRQSALNPGLVSNARDVCTRWTAAVVVLHVQFRITLPGLSGFELQADRADSARGNRGAASIFGDQVICCGASGEGKTGKRHGRRTHVCDCNVL